MLPLTVSAATHAWADRFAPMPLPMLRTTRCGMDVWLERPDDADANRIADVVLRDPLMSLNVLADTARLLAGRLDTPPETVTSALVLTGTDHFFRTFDGTPVLEERLAGQPEALAGAQIALERAHRGARLAAAFAIHRQDTHAERVHQAALLHDFAGLLCWVEVPAQALDMASRQAADATLRTADVRRAVLGTDLDAVADRLMQLWGLPAAVLDAGSGHSSIVSLAVRLARHVELGWQHPAVTDDCAEAGRLLNLTSLAAAQLVRQALA